MLVPLPVKISRCAGRRCEGAHPNPVSRAGQSKFHTNHSGNQRTSGGSRETSKGASQVGLRPWRCRSRGRRTLPFQMENPMLRGNCLTFSGVAHTMVAGQEFRNRQTASSDC